MVKSINILAFGRIGMKEYSTHELLNRGTPDFQIELYNVDYNHPRYHMQYHWHNKYEIVYVASGSLTLNLNGKTFVLNPGESVFIPGGVVHSGTPKNCKYMCIVFSASMLYGSQKSKTFVKQFNFPIMIKDNDLTQSIIEDMTERTHGYELSVTGKLYLLIHILLQMNNENKAKPNKEFENIKPALSYIQDNYYNEIMLEQLSTLCNMNIHYFCKFFKKITDETPMGYIQRYRIEMGCEFLLSGMSVTDTAYACGFNDTSYFINIFKKHMGITPKQYQKTKR